MVFRRFRRGEGEHPGGRAVAHRAPDHRLGDLRVAPPAPEGVVAVDAFDHLAVRFGRRAHRRAHEALELVGHRLAVLVHDRGCADTAARTHVDTLGRDRDERPGRSGLVVDKDPDRYRRIEDHRADRVGGVDQSAVGVEPDQHQFGAAGAGVGEAFGHQPLLRGHDVAVDREGIDDRGLSLCSGCGGVRLAVRVLRGVAGGGVLCSGSAGLRGPARSRDDVLLARCAGHRVDSGIVAVLPGGLFVQRREGGGEGLRSRSRKDAPAEQQCGQ